MNRVKRCAFKFGVLDRSIQDLVALAEHRLTSTWKMRPASDMGTFSEPELCNLAVVGAFAVFAQASDRIIVGIYSRERLLADRAAKYNVGRRKSQADALLRIGHHQADRSLKRRS